MAILTDARRRVLARVLLGLLVAATVLVGGAGVAEARHGADDPSGHVRGGHGLDDRGGDDHRGGGDDHLGRHGPRHR